MSRQRHSFTLLATVLLATTLVPSASARARAATTTSLSDTTGPPVGFYWPIRPVMSRYAGWLDSLGTWQQKPWSVLDNAHRRMLLPNFNSTMAVAKVDYSGKITYLGSAMTAEKGSYQITLDYMNYVVTPIYAGGDTVCGKFRADTLLGQVLVGVGMRMTASIRTTKANLAINSIVGLGAAAQSGSLSGGITIDVIGITSQEIQNLFVTTSTIDETSIQKSLEALAAIKSKIADSSTILTPQVVAVVGLAPGVSSRRLMSYLMSWQ